MNSLAYTFTIGPGELTKQGLYLLNSILENTEAEKDEIFVYVTEEEKEDIDRKAIKEINEKATLLEGPMPNPDYPLSAAHGALKKASQATDKDYILLLDTDTIVLDDIKVQDRKEADLFLTPETLARKYWASKEKSKNEFRQFFEKYGFEYPDRKVYSTFGEKEINPYYNGGFILVKNNNDFPEKWLELSKEVHGALPKYNIKTEMITLSLLASEYEVETLGPKYNFFQTLYPYPYEGTKIVHYVETETLYRGIYLSKKIGSGWFASKIKETGLLEDYNSINKIKKALIILNESYFSYKVRVKGGETLNFKIRKKLIRLLELTSTKQLARDIANTILREEKFKEEKFK